jgi:hypothetical protein
MQYAIMKLLNHRLLIQHRPIYVFEVDIAVERNRKTEQMMRETTKNVGLLRG